MKHLMDKLHHFDFYKHMRCIGVLSILIYIVTQAFESLGIAHVCVYCQTIRVSIGLIGVMMLLPFCPIFSRLFTMMVAFMGAYVAAAGIFINIQRATYFTSFTLLAACAMFVLAAQVMIMISYKTPVTAK